MSMKTTCNNCNASYELKEELAWKKAKCPKCWNVINIPEAEEIIEITDNVTENTSNSIEKETKINNWDKEPYKIIKPKIIKSLLFLSAWLQLILILVFIIIFALMLISELWSQTVGIWISIITFIFLGIAYGKYWVLKRGLEKMDYKFYDSKIEYYDWFLVKNRKTIKISRITEVSQSRWIIERIFGLGTINISTAGSIWYEISMSYLENSDDVYDFIDGIISQYEENKKSGNSVNRNITLESNQSEKIEINNENIEETKWEVIKNEKIIKPKVIKSLLFLNALGSSFSWLFVIAIFGWEFLILLNVGTLIFLFLLLIVITYLLAKKQLEKISYKFYDNKIEYYDWFLVKNKKTIKINKITDVSQKRGIVERIFWLGTIGLSTAGSHWNEISMSYLENSDDVYSFVDNIVSANND